MQFNNTWSQGLITLSVVLFSLTISFAQELDKATVEKVVSSKQFVFKAQTVLPMRGSIRSLTSDYEVRLLGDSVISHLPYFGRVYNATYGGSGGVEFTSTKFGYKSKLRKKGGWDVTIETKDVMDRQKLIFYISETGYATLQVTDNNREQISFNGYIVEK
jgi:hypothetical protein